MASYISRSEFEYRHAAIDSVESDIALRSCIATTPRHPDTADSGPLAGLAIAIKDNIEARGLPGSAGSLALIDFPATRDADIVTKIRAAGGDIVASTNLSEWANMRSNGSTSGWSGVGGLTANPWALDRSAGGSSSGSGAAVAAGLVSVAIGTETDGSIVCPAALNGVVGLKPTVGTVSIQGVVPVSSSQDVPGPIAIDVALAARTLSVLADREDALAAVENSAEIARNIRVGIARNWFTGHAATDARLEAILPLIESIAASVSDSQIPAADEPQVGEDELAVLLADLKDDIDAYLAQRLGADHPRASLEAIAQFNRDNADRELQHFDQFWFDEALRRGGRSAIDFETVRHRNLRWARETCFGAALEQHDVFIAPTYAPAWKSDLTLRDQYFGGGVTSPAAIAGYPLISIPMGLVKGLPVGLCIAAAAHQEPLLIALAHELEKVLGCRPEDGYLPTFRAAERG